MTGGPTNLVPQTAPHQHHALIAAHPPVTSSYQPDFDVDFLGVRTRHSFYAGMISGSESAGAPERATPSYPRFNEEYFEWVDIFETVEAAVDEYVIIELGAGYGRWCVRAALAARRRPSLRFACVAIEAEPDHFRWLGDHFRDNGIDPANHELTWAAVGAQPGFVPFWIGKADSWYGQAVAQDAVTPLPNVQERRRLRLRSVLGRPQAHGVTDAGVTWVPCITLSDVLAPYPRVDLIDLDVQGAELDVLRSAIDLVTQRVRRVHIGTHSPSIEQGLRELFLTRGWRKLNDYPCQSRSTTPYGEVDFGDGVQTWLNPSLHPWPLPLPGQARAMSKKTRGRDVPAGSSQLTQNTARARGALRRLKRMIQRTRDLKTENARLRERCRTLEAKVETLRESRAASGLLRRLIRFKGPR